MGAYTVAIMMKAGFSFWLASPVAIVLCFVLGLVIGFRHCACNCTIWALRHWASIVAGAVLPQRRMADWRYLRHPEHQAPGTFRFSFEAIWRSTFWCC